MEAIYPVRINKYLSSQNYCSRREADGLIKYRIGENKRANRRFGRQSLRKDKVEVSQSVKDRTSRLKYYAYHKPAEIVTHTPEEDQKEISDIFPVKDKTIFPVAGWTSLRAD